VIAVRFRPADCLLVVVILVLLASCTGNRGGDPDRGDGPSARDIKAEDIKDATPRSEPLARYGNHSPYEVFGKKYYVMDSSEGYHQRGTASWYGSKFHGRKTSSGEKYDMHLPTAAHKTLPLPTYAEVTNLSNGKKVIVKINDRGPFKDDRLIDMSYAAAIRLDMINAGTAPVDVRVLDGGTPFVQTEKIADTWLQAGAFGDRDAAQDLVKKLERSDIEPASIKSGDDLFRVWLGPYDTNKKIQAVINRAIELGFERPHRVKR
jgi:rare lipoprotein A